MMRRQSSVDDEETVIKLVKGAAAAADLANLPDLIPAAGISEAPQKYFTNVFARFADRVTRLLEECSCLNTTISYLLHIVDQRKSVNDNPTPRLMFHIDQWL